MCGIAGYAGELEVDAAPMLRRMTDAMEHRGPDGEGFTYGRGFGLGHRRLAVIDRKGGDQPMWSPDRRYAMAYNGEVYNYRELRDELSAAGYAFSSASDTEVVLAAWRHWGNDAFDRFNGMFALAIADTHTGTVVLARDQFGIKPLYLAHTFGGACAFASEIRPLLATRVVPREPDDATIYRYLRFRVHDDTERTFFSGITRLMPGHLAVVGPDGRVRSEPYTLLSDRMRAKGSRPYDEAVAERFGAELREAVRRRLVSDVPVGTALSGGLDSSTIVAHAHDLLARSDRDAGSLGERQRTFSAVFPGELNDEERYVDAVAEGRTDALTVHKVHPTPERFLADLRDFVRTQEEPVISTGPYAQYCVMREASEHVTVMMDGQGADEMMAGYVPYYMVHMRQLWREGHRLRALRELARSVDVLWRLGRFALADRLRGRRRVPVNTLLARDFRAAHADERLGMVDDDLKTRLADDIFRHSLQSLLRYEDRNTMRFSIEGRVPFLDANLIDLLWSHDESMILSGGWNKRVLRDATRGLLPPMINQRRNKIGFTTPEDAWFKRIKNAVYEIFASESFGRRPYFDQASVLEAFKSYVAGRSGAETMTFWRLMNVELWMREFIDTDPPETTGAAVETESRSKGDLVPNPDKHLLTPDGAWARFPLRCDLVGPRDEIPALVATRVSAFAANLAAAEPPTRDLAWGPWYAFVSEKIVAIAQERSFFVWDINPGWWARRLSKHVVRTPFGIGLGDPTTMHLAIQEAGLPRILAASAASAAGKLVGRRGLFYQVAGSQVRAIDGPTPYSAYPANVSAKLAPANPHAVARQISAALTLALPVPLLERFGGTVIIDANDIGQNILGHDTTLTEPQLAAAFADNPLGQGREQTPIAVVFAQGDDTHARLGNQPHMTRC
ncbi:MAG TPA: asparagine synthase (glutamine-hydrolyzing) [Stackebrandtia sp.]|uniref:asparagine synthase (glutamine-hydrolyzing) n=1 Tax=Stackebrandtia sp. TaxID=2023065 RepID=UPI002D5026F6|nr:asparagine synthase (glutamine-hydrolyzing) [Stackebrandtia sp.]HZE39097.1 asparagine synthase (glutamine-hydrolyzing) [Stackebrandtia sp.]